MTDENTLHELRAAWLRFGEATSQLTRLAGYKNLTRDMRRDRDRWHDQESEARSTLNRLLHAGKSAAPTYSLADIRHGDGFPADARFLLVQGAAATTPET